MEAIYREAFAVPFAKRSEPFMEERLLVVGGGTMGCGIALVAARGGYEVEIVEPVPAARERGIESLERETRRSGDGALLERIRWSDTIGSNGAAIAIEAVPERFDLKRDVLTTLAGTLSADALLATNTSSLSVAELADTVPHPERVVGLHFFNPPARMQLLEVVAAAQTSDETLERAYDVAAKLGKTAVLASDTPGFIVNRVARPFYLQALRAFERGIAPVHELDALARGVGFRMGPFELMDLIGLDVNLATTESIYARTEADRFAPVELQRGMVRQGLLGRKSGAGFYDYRDGPPRRYEPAVAEPQGGPNAQEVVAVLGFGMRADELAELLEQRFVNVARVENEELLDELSTATTIVVDAGDGSSDRSEAIAQLDSLLGAQSVFFVDAYATDLRVCAQRMRHPERLAGYGILGSLATQRAIEIVDSQAASDDALELAQELFNAIGKGVVLVEESPALFLGRTVCSIVNEAMIAVAEEVASADDIDTAMRLGANYPIGPIAWGREIGGARVARILKRLAYNEGDAFAPHRSLWMLDVAENPSEETVE
jgi:3-hydroxybutyryl-CoA dehydrogenase